MCRIHLFMKQAEEALENFLASKTLADISHEVAQKAPQRFLRDTGIWFHQRRGERAMKKK